MSNELVIAGIEINTDSEGRFNLNALHKASEHADNPSKRPNEWLRSQPTKELISELESQNGSARSGTKSNTYGVINVKNGGNAPGTFAHELLAISYAGWISPKFQLLVNQTFLDYKRGKLTPQPKIPQTYADALQLAADQARQIERQKLEIQSQSKTIRLQKPAVEFVDNYVKSKSSYTIRETAKLLGVGERAFIDALVQANVLFRQSGTLLPYASYQHRGFFVVKAGEYNGQIRNQTRFTPKGIEWISR